MNYNKGGRYLLLPHYCRVRIPGPLCIIKASHLYPPNSSRSPILFYLFQNGNMWRKVMAMDDNLLKFNSTFPNSSTVSSNDGDDIGKLVFTIEFSHRIFIIVFGSIGNCLSVVIFAGKHLRHLSSSYYLSALAISDTLFLLVLFLGWLQSAGAHILLEDVYCQLQNYFLNVFGFLSVWFVVAFTVERFIAVQYPLMRPSMCTASRAKAVILALVVVSILLFVPSLAADIVISTNPNNNISACISTNVTSMDSVMNAVDLALVMIVPSVAIVSINTCICLTVHRLSRMRRRMTLNSGKRGVDQSRQQHNPSQRASNSQNTVTRLLLVVSTVFVCLNLPSHIIRLILYIPGTEVSNCYAIYRLGSTIAQRLVHVTKRSRDETWCHCTLYIRTGKVCPSRRRIHIGTRIHR